MERVASAAKAAKQHVNAEGHLPTNRSVWRMNEKVSRVTRLGELAQWAIA
jgi:hypothetical protein